MSPVEHAAQYGRAPRAYRPGRYGIIGNHAPNGGETEFRSTGQDRDTIATRMQAEGYRTALVGKYMNGYKGEYVSPWWSY